MKIAGFVPTTLLDYPEKLACTLFTAGCNFRCPFCQNGSLVLEQEPKYKDIDEIFAFLKKRKSILEGVCITGGEPTLQKDLPDFIAKIKELGLLVKLDTNGFMPETLISLVNRQLIDYVAMDIKSSLSSYKDATGLPFLDTEKIKTSVDFLLSGVVDYEFRTTLVKGLHTTDDMEEIGVWLKGAKRYFLQSYEESGLILAKLENNPIPLSSFTRDELEDFLLIAKKHLPSASLRGV